MSSKEIKIHTDNKEIVGDLTLLKDSKGLVLFAHGSGSSRKSVRNNFVAKIMNEKGLSTCLFDLLTIEEEKIDNVTRELRFDIEFLANRLNSVIDWLKSNTDTQDLNIGLYGSSTGGAAALIAAAKNPKYIQACVSRGGRPDLALDYLDQVKCPTLFIVGGLDAQVLELNQDAYEKLQCDKKLDVVQNATHLFEEEGALEEVSELSSGFLKQHLD